MWNTMPGFSPTESSQISLYQHRNVICNSSLLLTEEFIALFSFVYLFAKMLKFTLHGYVLNSPFALMLKLLSLLFWGASRITWKNQNHRSSVMRTKQFLNSFLHFFFFFFGLACGCYVMKNMYRLSFFSLLFA